MSRTTLRTVTAAKICLSSTVISITLWLAMSIVRGETSSSDAPQYNSGGQLLLPADFETWVFVGSNLGLAYREELPESTAAEADRATHAFFHNVYIDRRAYDYFAEHRSFPDRTMLVMEIFAAQDKEPKAILTAGKFNGDRMGVEVAVKNSSRPDGHSTAWAYYDFSGGPNPGTLKAAASAFPDDRCETCHRKHASSDNVWVQFYPALRRFLDAPRRAP